MSFSENVSLIDRPEWGDEVVRNQDQTVKHPLEINAFMAWILGALCFFGFPLNFEIILRIFYDKTMRLKPRYITQLGVAFSDLFILFCHWTERNSLPHLRLILYGNCVQLLLLKQFLVFTRLFYGHFFPFVAFG